MKASPAGMSRPVAVVAAALILCLTVLTLQRAYGVVQVPNALRYAFAVPGGGVTADVAWPVSNYPIYLAATTYTVGWRGTGNVSVTYATTAPAITSWSGVHASGTNLTVAQGWTSVAAARICIVGFGGAVWLTTGGAGPQSWRLLNTTPAVKNVTVLEVY